MLLDIDPFHTLLFPLCTCPIHNHGQQNTFCFNPICNLQWLKESLTFVLPKGESITSKQLLVWVIPPFDCVHKDMKPLQVNQGGQQAWHWLGGWIKIMKMLSCSSRTIQQITDEDLDCYNMLENHGTLMEELRCHEKPQSLQRARQPGSTGQLHVSLHAVLLPDGSLDMDA